MVHISAILLIICIIEWIIIFWFRRNSGKKIDIEETVTFFRNFGGKFVLYVIATSIIGLFLGSIYFEKVVGLNEINAWVGIVLGLVALIIGIISLFLSFYNVEQSNKVQKETVDIMNKVKTDIEDKLTEIRAEMKKGFSDITSGREYRGDQEAPEKVETKKDNAEWEKIDE